jgi:hypothetical protein
MIETWGFYAFPATNETDAPEKITKQQYQQSFDDALELWEKCVRRAPLRNAWSCAITTSRNRVRRSAHQADALHRRWQCFVAAPRRSSR